MRKLFEKAFFFFSFSYFYGYGYFCRAKQKNVMQPALQAL